ncbi:hypothetical protein TBK1r_72910 [Stieleria magnilauensis]|uniref:Uncharacterized protein n=1 Tax=Stieleria magnilauensis TaxID=2527963 RepID=A0ABX5Y1X7_9BACT|nr:hypothetical protein TBK1r_72910 [Planctomycetes bacterium TBK1r]
MMRSPSPMWHHHWLQRRTGGPGRQADASFLNPPAAGHQRFVAVGVLISCGPLSDPQTHGSPVTRVVWSEGVFLRLEDESERTQVAPLLGSRATSDIGSAPMRSTRRWQHSVDDLRPRDSGSRRSGDGSDDRGKRVQRARRTGDARETSIVLLSDIWAKHRSVVHTAERCHNKARGREAHPGVGAQRTGEPQRGSTNGAAQSGVRKRRRELGEPCCSVQPRWGWRPDGDRTLGCADATPSFDGARRWRETAT